MVPAPSGPDQVDMTMGAHIDGFTRAWIDVAGAPRARSTTTTTIRVRTTTIRVWTTARAPVGAGSGSKSWEPFVVPRALDALLGDVSDESDRTLISNALRAAAAVRAEDAREEWLAGNAFDRFVHNDDEEEDDGGGGRRGGGSSGETSEQTERVPDGGHHRQRPRAVPASMPRRGYSRGRVRRLPPRPKRGAGAGRKTKAGRRSAAEDAGVGVTEAYWRELQTSQRDRPVGRLRLASAVDAALVWDGRRPFELEAADRDLLAEVLSEKEGGFQGGGEPRDAPVEGNVAGVWRRRGGASGGGPTRIRSFPSDESKTMMA